MVVPCVGRGFPCLLNEGKYVRTLLFLEPQCLSRRVEEAGLESSLLSFTLGGCTPTGSSPSPRFPTEIHSGLLEVISPSPHFYPDFSRLRESFGDPKERVRYLYSVPSRSCWCLATIIVSFKDPEGWVGGWAQWVLPASVASLW